MYVYGSWMHGSGMLGIDPLMFLMWLILILLVAALIEILTKRLGLGTNKKTYIGTLK